MNQASSTLILELKPGRAARFVPIFQRGFILCATAGSSMEEMLGKAGFCRNYLREKVQTIFLDGSAIDDPASTFVADGATIALSAAMPGVAGAILRKGGVLAPLRSRTAHAGDSALGCDGEKEVVLKLFNFIADEMGPGLLRDGILMKRADIEGFLQSRREFVEESILAAQLDGEKIDVRELFGRECSFSERIFLQVM